MAQQATREQAEWEENQRAYYAEQEHQQYLDAMREQENEYCELLEMIELAEEMAVIQ